MTTLAADDMLKLAQAERLKQLVDPEFAKLPKSEQLSRAGLLVMSAKPRLAEEYRNEPDTVERLGSPEKAAMVRAGREDA